LLFVSTLLQVKAVFDLKINCISLFICQTKQIDALKKAVRSYLTAF